jgi:multidrug resistance protein, MATE family
MTTQTQRPPAAGPIRRGASRRRRLFVHELRRLLALAGPIIVSQLGMVGMNTADTIMVGPLGASQLAAAGLGSAIHFFGIVLSMGAIMGMAPLVSQAFGAGDAQRCREILVQGAWLALLLSVPIMAMNYWGDALAGLLGQQGDVRALAGGYMRALTLGVPPFFLFMAGRQYLENMGLAKPAMVITFLALGLNIVANRIFMYGVDGVIPAMGVIGTGWATTLVRWVMCAALVAYILMHPSLRPTGVRPTPRPPLLRRMLAIGGPVAGQFGLEVGLFSFAAVMMGWIGPIPLAAHQVTINIASTTFMVALGVSLAGSARVGRHIGARRVRAMRRAVAGTYILAVGFMALCALLFVALPHGLIGLYTSDPAILALGAQLLLFAAAFQIFDGAQVAGVSVLRGAADTRTAAVVAAIGYWGIGVPLAYGLAFRTTMSYNGIWAGLAAGLLVAAILLAFRARRVLWLTPINQLHAGSDAVH